MGQFASFVLTKDREFWGPTDSHSDIIEHHGLHEDGCRGPNIVRVEIVPPKDDTRAPLDKWIFIVDQDRFPVWFDRELCEQRARTAILRRSQEEKWFQIAECDGSSVGYAGTATAGTRGTATAGDSGILTIRWWDDKSERCRIAVAYVGEDGIEPGIAYKFNAETRKFERVEP